MSLVGTSMAQYLIERWPLRGPALLKVRCYR